MSSEERSDEEIAVLLTESWRSYHCSVCSASPGESCLDLPAKKWLSVPHNRRVQRAVFAVRTEEAMARGLAWREARDRAHRLAELLDKI